METPRPPHWVEDRAGPFMTSALSLWEEISRFDQKGLLRVVFCRTKPGKPDWGLHVNTSPLQWRTLGVSVAGQFLLGFVCLAHTSLPLLYLWRKCPRAMWGDLWGLISVLILIPPTPPSGAILTSPGSTLREVLSYFLLCTPKMGC